MPAAALDASELRSSNPIVDAKTLYVAVSQSGETADTIGAAREILTKGGRVVGVINAVGSSLARLCGGGAYVHAGAEVSVATTKAFVNQALVLALLALLLGQDALPLALPRQADRRRARGLPRASSRRRSSSCRTSPGSRNASAARAAPSSWAGGRSTPPPSRAPSS